MTDAMRGSRPLGGRWALAPLLLGIAMLTLLAAGLFITMYSEHLYAEQTRRDTAVQAQILAASVTAALDFGDVESTRDYLNALRLNPKIEAAAIYHADGTIAASYSRAGDTLPNAVRARSNARGGISIVEPVKGSSGVIGYVYVRSSIEPFARRLARYAGIAVLVGMGLIMLAGAALGYGVLRRANAALSQRAEALADSEARHRAYWDNTDEALFSLAVSDRGEIRFEGLNPSHERKTGLRSHIATGKTAAEFLPPDIASQLEENYRRCLETGQPQHYEETLTFPEGTRHWETVIAPVRDGSGRIARIIGSARDITQRKTAEEALHQSQKMEAVGQLTGGIAHDFNNLLTPIVGSLDMIRRRASDERSVRLVTAALQSAERASTLVKRLLAFARRQELEPRAVDVNAIISDMADLIDRSVGPQVEVSVALADRLPIIFVDPNQFELAILNLVVNARDAMPAGGAIVIETRSEQDEQGVHNVTVAVKDNGCGMDEATLNRATEPFFSTKGLGKGTGLGLAMVHGLAAQSGGSLILRSRIGEGTQAQLTFPGGGWAPEQPRVTEAEELVRAPWPATILVVDDEKLVRMGTSEMLRDLGYEVKATASANEALDLIRAGTEPDLVITDQLMPGMTGAQLVRELRKMRPRLPVLLVTGYANLLPDEAEGLARLSKPFRYSALAARAAEMLDPTTARAGSDCPYSST